MKFPKLKSGKKEPKQYVDDNPFETIGSIGRDMLKSAKQDLVLGGAQDAKDEFLEFLKLPPAKQSVQSGAEMMAGQEVDLDELKNREQVKPKAEAGNNYHREIVEAGRRTVSHESREIEVRIQEVLIEIKQLANSSKELKKKIEVVTVEQMGEAPGKYHLNFVEQVLSWVRDARMNVEDSLAWFHALRSKKAARQYGVMAKKGGTSFTLSGERATATQTG